MHRLPRADWLALAGLWLLLVPLAASSETRHPQLREARLAVLLDLEGAQASLGRPAMNGFVLGLTQAGSAQAVPFAALVDTRSDPEVTVSAARRLAPSVSLAAGFTDNDSVLIAGPVFQRARVPFLSIGATDPALPARIGDRVFLAPFGDNTQAAAAAEFGRREFGGSVAILWDDTSAYTRSLPRYFRTRFEQLAGAVLLDASYPGGCDVGALAAQVAALSPPPDFVYLAGLPDCVGEVVASLRTAGVDGPVIGGDGLDTPELLVPGPTDDVWYTTHAWLSQEDGTPEAKAFLAAYEAAYGSAPPDAFAALGYDAARLLLAALDRARNPRDLLAALEQTEGFPGVTGSISFGTRSHVPSKTVWLIAVQDGEKSLASAFVPDSVPPALLSEP